MLERLGSLMMTLTIVHHTQGLILSGRADAAPAAMTFIIDGLYAAGYEDAPVHHGDQGCYRFIAARGEIDVIIEMRTAAASTTRNVLQFPQADKASAFLGELQRTFQR